MEPRFVEASAVAFLIDGYNLLFALGLASKRTEPKAFELARAKLLAWLHEAHGTDVSSVTVVFDAQHVAVGGRPEWNDRGLRVLFAVGMLADDRIEELIREEVNPRKLTVVSSDHRIQVAARRRGCTVWDAAEYIDWAMARQQRPKASAPMPGKPDSSPAEVERWLREFGDIDTDPDVRKFNKPFEDFEGG